MQAFKRSVTSHFSGIAKSFGSELKAISESLYGFITVNAVTTIGVYHGHFPGICVKVRERAANDGLNVDDVRDIGLANIVAFTNPAAKEHGYPEKYWTAESLDAELRSLRQDLLDYGRPFLSEAEADWKGLRRFLDEQIKKNDLEMPWLGKYRVLAAVQKDRPKSSWARVLKLLDSYGVESYERERERVQLAILKLSEGNEEKLREFVAVAKRDYRDVLFWAENPEEAKLDTPEKRERIKERMKKMFEKFGIKPPDDF